MRNDAYDVGKIIRLIASYTIGTPREVKRMVNLARLYLHLRNDRRLTEPSWSSPSLDQYARWIALTLRRQDMMRWLKWGADEASSPTANLSQDLIVRWLMTLEAAAAECSLGNGWVEILSKRFDFGEKDKID